MTSALFIAVSLLIWANLAFVACSGPASPDPIPRYDAETFYETTAITGASFSHDEERILISTDASGVFNAYSQPFEGGPPVQLTESEDDSIFAVSWFPDDDRFLYTADQGGNELNHLYVRETDGSVWDLTPGDQLKAMFGGWSGDRESFCSPDKRARPSLLRPVPVQGRRLPAGTGLAERRGLDARKRQP